MEDDTMEYVYQLIIGQLIFDGFQKAVKTLTSELHWTGEKQINGSDELLKIIVGAKSSSSGTKSKGKQSGHHGDQKDKKDTRKEVAANPKRKKVVEKVREPAKLKPAQKNAERIVCKYCQCEFSRDAAYERHLRKHKHEERQIEKVGEDIVQIMLGKQMKPPKRESAKNTADEFKMSLEVEGLRQEIVDECGNDSRDTVTLPKEEIESKEQILDAARNVSEQEDLSSKNRKSSAKHLDKVCKICNTKFRLIKNLRVHMQEKHSGIKFSPYKCRRCDASFEDTMKRYKHEAVEHDGLHPKPIKQICDLCGVTLNTASALTYHVRAFHTGVKPYNCSYCDKRFVKNSHLVRHHRMHTGEKPYICTTCGKKFADNSGLTNHQAREHSVGNENDHKCSVCCKIYKSVVDLKRHEKSHMANEDRPFQCKTCGKRFTMQSVLKEHARIHTGIKPYICQICGKSFTQNAHLKYHLKIHTEEKPYKCDICGTGFRCAAARRKHLMSHANKRANEQRMNRDTYHQVIRKRKVDTKKTTASKIARKHENSAGLQAAKGLVAMAAGQGTSEKPAQQIIIIASSSGSSEEKQYLLTPGGQLVQQVVMQQQVETSVPNYTSNESSSLAQNASQGFAKPLAVQNLKIAESGAKGDRSVEKGGSERYQLIFVPPQESVATNTVHSTEGHASNSQDTHSGVLSTQTIQHTPVATTSEIQVTSVGEQVVSQQHSDARYVVMETDQEGGVYQTGDIVSLSMAASNVGQGVESEQLIEEHVVDSEAAVVTSVQWG